MATAGREAQLGYTFGGHRIFQSQQSTFQITANSAAQLQDDAAKKRTSYLSVRIPAGETWDTFASHRSDMAALARQLGEYSHPIVFVLEHEPDVSNDNARTKGTVTGYSMMVGNMYAAVREHAPDVSTAVAFGGHKLLRGNSRGSSSERFCPPIAGLSTSSVAACSTSRRRRRTPSASRA